jgi:ABC-type branched-subunit amino acid transport system substrate-binding protein
MEFARYSLPPNGTASQNRTDKVIDTTTRLNFSYAIRPLAEAQPDLTWSYFYDAFMLYAHAATRTLGEGTEISRVAFNKKVMSNLLNGKTQFEGLSGWVTLDENGDRSPDAILTSVQMDKGGNLFDSSRDLIKLVSL